jgi:hypothetical protein
VPNQQWGIHCPAVKESFCLGSDSGRSLFRLNYFILMFPPDHQLVAIIELTNMRLIMAKGKKALAKGEFLNFIGVVMLCTRFEFGERASLWSTTTAWSKYQPAACFGKKLEWFGSALMNFGATLP